MTKPQRALVGNAGDSEQVRRAALTERMKAQRDENDMRQVLSSVEGRRVLWRLMEQASVFRSIFDINPVQMGYLAGRQDFGHVIVAKITAASPSAWVAMQREAAQLKEVEMPEQPERLENTDSEDVNARND